jgi:hypothetical protein
MTKNREAHIGDENGEYVSLKRVTPSGIENWFDAEVEVQCDGWRGKIRAEFMQGELTRFAEEIRNLHKNLFGEALLNPIEPHLTLSLIGDGKGHILVKGTAQNRLGGGTELSFRLEIDQTYLLAIADALCDIDASDQG